MTQSTASGRAWITRVGAGAVAAAAGTVCGQPGIPTGPRIILDPRPIEQPAPVVACFKPGTDPAYMDMANHIVHVRNLAFFGTDYNLGNRWSGAQGSPRALTWSFVPDGLVITGGSSEPSSPSDLFFQMDGGFSTQGGRATWINRFQQVFDRYAQLTGNTYTRVRFNNNDWDDGASWGSPGAAGFRGDVRIGMHFIDGSGGGILAYNYYPSSGDMVLDSADLSYFTAPGSANRNFRNTIGHEHGHGLGLAHTCSSDSLILMAPAVGDVFDGPRQDDIRAVQRHYGDPYEPNDSFAAAKPMGALVPGSPLTLGTIPNPVAGTNDVNAALLSIDADGEQDWFSFTVSASVSITAVVTPVGSLYDDSTQAGNGSCPSGSFTNAKNIADLVLTAYGSNGTTVLATASAAGLGQAETISNLQLPSTGTYYLRVTENNLPQGTQLYRLSVSSSCAVVPSITLQPLSQTVNNGGNVQFTAAAINAASYQWRKDGVDVQNGPRIAGAATPTLTITGLLSSDAGVYTLRAAGTCATATSNDATLTVVCYPNCDGSTTPPILNISDFVCFQTKYFAGDTTANCDGSTRTPVLNIYDFLCFQARYVAGCS